MIGLGLSVLNNKFGNSYALPVSGATLWLDAQQESYSNNDSVGIWTDRSGQGNDAVQTTEANKPVFKTSGIGGVKSILFDGINDGFDLTSGLSSSGSYTVFTVWDMTAGQMAALLSFSTTNTYNQLVSGGNTYIRNSLGYKSIASTPTGESIYTTVSDGTLSGQSLYRNNSLLTLSAATSLAGYAFMETVGYGFSSNAEGYIAEIIYYPSVLSGADITTVNTYLNNKYNSIY